jgi:hypothetical protein
MRLIFIIGTFAVVFSTTGSSQPDTMKHIGDKQLQRPNAVEGNILMQTLFDSHGFIQEENVGFRNWLNLRYGVTYKRRFTARHAVSVSVNRLLTSFEPKDNKRKPWDLGEVQARLFWLFEADYRYYLLYNDKLKIKGTAGLDYRHGHETIHMWYRGLHEKIGGGYDLKDFGLSAGFEAEIELFWHIYASGQVEYTRFVYIYSKGPPGYKHSDGPSKNMLSFQLGLGYRF